MYNRDASLGDVYGPVPKSFDVTPEVKRVEISISLSNLAGVFGVSDIKVYRWPAACIANSRMGQPMDGMT